MAKGENGKKGRGPWLVVFVIALVVLVGSLAALGVIGFSYLQGQQKYEHVAQAVRFDVREVEALPGDEVELDDLTVDWDALKTANADTVAWIFIPGTQVNYPVVQASDNDYYLTVDFDGVAGWLANYGAIFLDYRDNPDFSSEGNFIYGHHMQDGSMFADISHMYEQERFDASRTVYLLTPSGNYRLRTFSLVHCDANDPLVQTSFATPDARAQYLADKIERSVVSVPDAPDPHDVDRLFALATCDDYSSGRYILYCYIEKTTAAGLSGSLGIAVEDGQAVGFEDALELSETR